MLSPKQLEAISFVERPGSIQCLVGAIRSGKSYVAAMAFALNLARLGEPKVHLLLGRKLRVLETEILPHIKNVAEMTWLPYKYAAARGVIEVGNQKIVIAAGNDEKSMDRIQGITAQSALIDEATLLPESFFTTAISRLSYKDSKAFVACNPSHPRHYLKEKWIDNGNVDQHLVFTFQDNPSLSDKVIERYDKIFTGTFRKRMVEGLWIASDGLVYPDFTTAERPPGRVVSVSAGMDYGIASPSAVVTVETIRGDDGKRKWHIPSVLYLDGGATKKNFTDLEISDRVSDYISACEISTLVLDPSAASLRNQLLKRPKKYNLRRGINDIAWGVRVAGAVLAHKEISINPKAVPLLDELGIYAWDENKPDTPIDAHNHCCDAMRYVLMDMFKYEFRQNADAIAIPEGL